MSKSQSSHSDPHVIPDDDGYTLTRYIEGVERMYAFLRFAYRPVSSTKRAKFRDGRKDGESEEASLKRLATAVASRIVTWNAVDLKGAELPRSQAGVLLLHPSLQVRLMNIIIYSIEGGDPDPEVSPVSNEDGDDTDPFGEKIPASDLLEGGRKN